MGPQGEATTWLAGRWLRRRWLAVVPLAAVVVIGTTATILAAHAGQQTADAYRGYLDRAGISDVVINPSVSSAEIDEVIRDLPGVEHVTTESLLQVSVDDGAPRTRQEMEEAVNTGPAINVFGSADGRYLTSDRPIVEEGRMPTGTLEAVLSRAAADESGLGIGDEVDLSFWSPTVTLGLAPERVATYMSEVVAPIGTDHVEVVGIVTPADEVLPDELYPRARAIVSADVAARYDCVPPSPDPALDLAANVDRLLPRDCAVLYRYYSLQLEHGAKDVKPALDQFVRRAAPLNERMAGIVDASGAGETLSYFLISTETEPILQRVERAATRPTVVAVLVLALAGATVTLALVGLAVVRDLRRGRGEGVQLHQLGVSRRTRALVGALPSLAAITIGAVVAVPLSAALDVGALGIVDRVDPGGVDLWPVPILVALTMAAVAGTFALGAAWIVARPHARALGRPRRRPALTIGPPAVADGVRGAVGQRGVLSLIAGGAVVVTAVVAAVVFGAGLTSLVDTPRAYGWPWDVAAMTGGGYGDLDLAGAHVALDDDPAVEAWTSFGFLGEAALDGEPLMAIVGLEREAALDLPLVEGTMPDRRDEIALGAATAGDRGLVVGDTVELSGGFEPIEATVSGIVVFPSLGPLLAEQVGAGVGMLLPQALVDAVDPSSGEELADDLATFVAVDLAPGASRADVRGQLEGLDLLGAPPLMLDAPVRPPEIIDASETRAVPYAVAIVLGAVGVLGFLVAAWSLVGARRREIAVLRAIGFVPAQVRTSLGTQSVTTMLVALVVGVPAGIVAGRLLWRAFARQLGVLDDLPLPWPAVGIIAAAALMIAALASIIPGRVLARDAPAAGLRAE